MVVASLKIRSFSMVPFVQVVTDRDMKVRPGRPPTTPAIIENPPAPTVSLVLFAAK